MPKFFFHVRDGVSLPDREGIDLVDERAARGEAVRASGEMLKDLDGRLWDMHAWRLDVCDADNRFLFALCVRVDEAELPPAGLQTGPPPDAA